MTPAEAKQIVDGDWAKLNKTMGDYREAKGFLEAWAVAVKLEKALRLSSCTCHSPTDHVCERCKALIEFNKAEGKSKIEKKCKHKRTWFDRTIISNSIGLKDGMHTRCSDCGMALD